MRIYMLLPFCCVILIGCNKQKTYVLPDAGVDNKQPSTAIRASNLGDWQTGYHKSDWGRITYNLKFSSDGLCSLLIFSIEMPDKPVGSIEGSWKLDGSSGMITWKQSKYLSDEMTLTKDLKDNPPESFYISDDSVLHLSQASGDLTFTKVSSE